MNLDHKVGSVIQYAYTVADLDAAIADFTARLRIGPWFRRARFTPTHARYRGAPTTVELTLARAFAGDSMIELIQQHGDAPSVYRELVERCGHGFHHWAIPTRDLDGDVAGYAAQGHPVAYEDTLPSGARVVYVDTTASLPGMVELVEYNAAQAEVYARFYRASLDWDGGEPVRPG